VDLGDLAAVQGPQEALGLRVVPRLDGGGDLLGGLDRQASLFVMCSSSTRRARMSRKKD
jgi:hypothetical protein